MLCTIQHRATDILSLLPSIGTPEIDHLMIGVGLPVATQSKVNVCPTNTSLSARDVVNDGPSTEDHINEINTSHSHLSFSV